MLINNNHKMMTGAPLAGMTSLFFENMANGGSVYIVSNKNLTTLYIGVNSNLQVRIYEHRTGEGSAFTKQYNFTDLLHFEFYEDI